MEIFGALGAVFGQLGFMGLIIGIVLFVNRQQRKRQLSTWRRLAQELSLDLMEGGTFSAPRMTGEVDGVQIQITRVARSAGKSSIPYTVVTAASPLSLPHGMSVTRENFGDSLMKVFGGQDIQLGDGRLDPELRIRGVDEDVIRQILLDDGVRPLLPRLAKASRYSRIQNDTVVIEERGRKDVQLEANVHTAIAMAQALSTAVQQPWQALAARTGLTITDGSGGLRIDGDHRGLRVSGRVLMGRSDPGTHTTIRVALPPGMPAIGITLADRKAATADHHGGLGVKLYDPILDGLVRVDARDADQARALLTGPQAIASDLHGKLLAVVHGQPGSVVTSREIRVVSPGATADTASQLIDQAIDLADALRDAAQEVPC